MCRACWCCGSCNANRRDVYHACSCCIQYECQWDVPFQSMMENSNICFKCIYWYEIMLTLKLMLCIPRIMTWYMLWLLLFGRLFCAYPWRLLDWQWDWGNRVIIIVRMKQLWRIWVKKNSPKIFEVMVILTKQSCEYIIWFILERDEDMKCVSHECVSYFLSKRSKITGGGSGNQFFHLEYDEPDLEPSFRTQSLWNC